MEPDHSVMHTRIYTDGTIRVMARAREGKEFSESVEGTVISYRPGLRDFSPELIELTDRESPALRSWFNVTALSLDNATQFLTSVVKLTKPDDPIWKWAAKSLLEKAVAMKMDSQSFDYGPGEAIRMISMAEEERGFTETLDEQVNDQGPAANISDDLLDEMMLDFNTITSESLLGSGVSASLSELLAPTEPASGNEFEISDPFGLNEIMDSGFSIFADQFDRLGSVHVADTPDVLQTHPFWESLLSEFRAKERSYSELLFSDYKVGHNTNLGGLISILLQVGDRPRKQDYTVAMPDLKDLKGF
jgi:hypothetical protein